MVQKDIEALSAFQVEAEDIVDLTGNSGKRVRRVLERYLPNGIFDRVLAAPAELSDFQFACYMALILEGCDMAEDYVAAVGQHVLFGATVVNVIERTYRLCIRVDSIPESMKGRQAFLKETSYGTRRITAVIEMRDRLVGHQALEDSFFERLYAEDRSQDSEENRELLKQRFDALLAQDYRDITEIPLALVDLAGLLDEDVLDALRSAVEGRPLDKAA